MTPNLLAFVKKKKVKRSKETRQKEAPACVKLKKTAVGANAGEFNGTKERLPAKVSSP